MFEIFRTIHGSRLYGLDHAGSDKDTFIVTTSNATKTKHTVSAEEDQQIVGLNLFLYRTYTGSHQSVEALFSPFKVWNPEYEHYRPMVEEMTVYGSNVFEKYERTIKNFCFGDFKRRRHAVRLSWNLMELRENGRFNPRMTDEQIGFSAFLAETMDGENLKDFLFS